jgi:hypothetical protein
MDRQPRFVSLQTFGLAAMLLAAASADAAGPDFAREVRPILSNRCFKCHGPDEEQREAGLRLDLREAATADLASGERAIVPGHADSSELVARIESDDPDLVMPPPHTKVSLTPAERQTLAAWINAGAPYAPHWAFVKPERPAVPNREHDTWSKTDIDRFVLARLTAEGLAPSPEADRATLCRRVHLDLVGLPPSPAELAAFLADSAPDAYERLVDRLLASPRYGERWARRWLDLARYADTNGFEKDRDRSIWPWRDWVIRALNDDLPFDEFTIRQLAGDMLPDATVDDIVATGFHRNTMINEEGGIDPLEYRYLAVVDRVGTTGAAWLGLTLACAQCHTHKFDPITHTDYFGVMAIFDNADEPEWTIPTPERFRRQADLERQISEAWQRLPERWPLPAESDALALDASFAAWERDEMARAIDWRISPPAAVTSSLPLLDVRPDGSVLASGDVTKSTVYEITLPPCDRETRSIRLEVLPDESLPAQGPGLTWYEGPKGDFFLSEFEVRSGDRRLEIAAASHSQAGRPSSSRTGSSAAAAIDGEMSSGWGINGDQGRPNAAVFQLAEPVPPATPLTITLRFERHYACAVGCFRFSVSDRGDAEARGHTAAEEAALVKPAADRTAVEQAAVRRRFLASAPELADAVAEIRRLEDALRGGTTTLVMRERPLAHRRTTHRRHRGEFTQPEEAVLPATPAFLPPLPADVPADRLAFARWLVSPDNPLTARVVVNRHWQAFFGRGLVKTLDDFGYQSDPPSHPELLDWLAVTFADDLGWSQKQLHRLIVTTATYRQASAVSPDLAARDPDNSLLARGPRVRLEAEVIRDSLLAAAGLLSDKMHGPGVRPPQPAGVTEVAFGNPKWEPSTGEDRHRRSIYTFQKRTAPFAMTMTFDGPSGETCLVRRDVSNSALQALTLLNDPMFLEVAKALAATVMATGSDDDARFDDLAARLLARRFTTTERDILTNYLAEQRRRLATGDLNAETILGEASPDAPDRAAWLLVTRVVMNLDETIVKQ